MCESHLAGARQHKQKFLKHRGHFLGLSESRIIAFGGSDREIGFPDVWKLPHGKLRVNDHQLFDYCHSEVVLVSILFWWANLGPTF